MANIDFPSNPTVGQTYVFAGVTYTYSVHGMWVPTLIPGGTGTGGGAVGDTTPGFQTYPQGRLTLQSATPVMITNTTGVTTIFYTPSLGNRVPIFDGTFMQMVTFYEITGSTLDTTKNPGPLGPNKNNDWFVWFDKTVPATPVVRLCHGPDWTDDTTRSAGTALTRVFGLMVNNADITNGPVAKFGTYVGTTRSDAASQLKWVQGTRALGGGAAFLNVWNAYNRAPSFTQVTDGTSSWSPPSGVWGMLNASSGNRVSWVNGIADDALFSSIWQPVISTPGGQLGAGMQLDGITTTVTTGPVGWLYQAPAGWGSTIGAINIFPAMMGYHFIQAVSYGNPGGQTFIGDQTFQQAGSLGQGMQASVRM